MYQKAKNKLLKAVLHAQLSKPTEVKFKTSAVAKEALKPTCTELIQRDNVQGPELSDLRTIYNMPLGNRF